MAAYEGGNISKEALLERWRAAPAGERAAIRTPEGMDATIRSLAVLEVGPGIGDYSLEAGRRTGPRGWRICLARAPEP